MVSVIRRHQLTDCEWELLAPLIPRAVTGRPRVEDRKIINGMVHKLRTGISWRDLPARYGPRKTVYTRFRRYALDGVFTRALQQIQAQADAAGDINWLVQIDSTVVRAHQHDAATGRKGGAHVIPEKTDQRRHRHNRGRRGGRPPGFDREAYRRRNMIEHCFNRLKGFRGIATRYEKTATSYEAAVTLASFLLWARSV